MNIYAHVPHTEGHQERWTRQTGWKKSAYSQNEEQNKNSLRIVNCQEDDGQLKGDSVAISIHSLAKPNKTCRMLKEWLWRKACLESGKPANLKIACNRWAKWAKGRSVAVLRTRCTDRWKQTKLHGKQLCDKHALQKPDRENLLDCGHRWTRSRIDAECWGRDANFIASHQFLCLSAASAASAVCAWLSMSGLQVGQGFSYIIEKWGRNLLRRLGSGGAGGKGGCRYYVLPCITHCTVKRSVTTINRW